MVVNGNIYLDNTDIANVSVMGEIFECLNF